MPLYFAYGSNMDAAAMAARCPKSETLGAAILLRHRFAVMEEGYATVVRDPRSNVYGLLWDVALADVRALDRYESVETGLYKKILQPVKRMNGSGVRPSHQAIVYVGSGGAGGFARAGYMENVIECATRLQFPPDYISLLEKFRRPGAAREFPASSAANSAANSAGGPGQKPRGQTYAQTALRDSEGNIRVRPRYDSPMDRDRG